MWLSSCSVPAVQPPSCSPIPAALPGLAEVHFEVKYLPCGLVSSLLVNTTCFPMTSVGVLGGCALHKVCGMCEAGKMLTEDALAQWRVSNFFPASFDARVGHRFTQNTSE